MSDETINSLDDLRQWREQIIDLARQHRARRIAVFGSLARGEVHAGSDIDFLVDFEADYKLRDHIRLTQALHRLLGRRVEVVDRQCLRDEWRATILQEAQGL
ncbi:MAG: nucleotidyltransferase domain-containing protein [Anaerolineaceae bacterium]|nr:nucleotidyltransferase domain-containing protein [Anaerolineaceae bacterium]